MIQLTVSMVISRLASYLVSTAILLMSAYMQSVLLFPNVSMFARSVEVVTNGQIAWVEVIIIAWISSICMLVGYLYLKNSDSVKIVGYEVMEKEKYFSKYDLSGKDQSVADPFAYIMEVTIKIKNEENETGKLQIADWALIGKNDDFIAYLDQQLLMDTDERVDSILSSISTASGKEIEIKLPYPLIYMDKEKEIDRNMPYKIAVTKYPSRKYIQFG